MIENSMVLPTATPEEYDDDATPGIDDLEDDLYERARQEQVDDLNDTLKDIGRSAHPWDGVPIMLRDQAE